jgi:hypothetical protein
VSNPVATRSLSRDNDRWRNPARIGAARRGTPVATGKARSPQEGGVGRVPCGALAPPIAIPGWARSGPDG